MHVTRGSGKNHGEAMQMMEVQKALCEAMGVVDKITQGESKREKKELTLGWREVEKKSPWRLRKRSQKNRRRTRRWSLESR